MDANATTPRLPLLRLVLFIFAGVLATTAVSFLVCLRTTNVSISIAVLGGTLAIVMTPIMRWWIRAARAAGVPKQQPLNPDRLRLAGGLLAVVAVCVFAEVRAFDLTHNRLLEVAIAFGVVACGGPYYVSRIVAMTPFQNSASRKLMRFTSFTQIGIVIIFSLNTWMQAHARHDYGLTALREATIAGNLILIPLSAIYAYYVLRRLAALEREASALQA